MTSEINNYIVSFNFRETIQFPVVQLPDNSPFLYDRKRIRCSGNYSDIVLAKIIAEEELKENRNNYSGELEDLDLLYEILKEQRLIEKVKMIGQKRKSIGDNIFKNDRIERHIILRRKIHYYKAGFN